MSMERLDMLIKAAAQKLDAVPSIKESGMTEYTLEQGNALAFGLLKKKGAAVADSFLSKGTIFPLHKHNGCREVLMVYAGKLTVISDDVDNSHVRLGPGDITIIEICVGHALFAKEDVWVIAATIPADENFPG